MSCKSNNKKIICETCNCSYDEDNKLKVTCLDCEDGEDKVIICESCNCIDNDENDKKEVCLKKCACNGKEEDTVYITCTEYEEDLD